MGSLIGAMGAESSRSFLSKEDLEFLKSKTQFDEQTICEYYRGFLSDCPAGKLSPKEFCQIYSKCFPTGNAREFCDHVFRTFDTDKNGFVDFKEFLLSIDVNSSGSAEEKLNWAFSMYDVDGNGYIDIYEMTKLVSSIYKMVGTTLMQLEDTAADRAQAIFDKMDIDSDGKVTKDEFCRTCLDDKDLLGLLAQNM